MKIILLLISITGNLNAENRLISGFAETLSASSITGEIPGSQLGSGSSNYIQNVGISPTFLVASGTISGQVILSTSTGGVFIATTPSSTGAKLTVGGPVVIDSATIPTLGLVPAFSIPCPQGYTRLGINKCHANSGTMETWFSSSPTGVNAAAFFTTTTVSLQNAQAKAVVIGVQCLHTNNTGSVSGTVLYTQQGGQGAIGQSSMACNGNTALNGQRTIDVAFKTVILDSSQQMNYYCRANDSAGSERECFVGILEIIQ